MTLNYRLYTLFKKILSQKDQVFQVNQEDHFFIQWDNKSISDHLYKQNR